MNIQKNQDIFTVLNAPTYYPLQTKLGYCGPCQIKTIVETKTNCDKIAKFYTNTLREKVVGGMSPLSIRRALKKNGFHPKIGFLIGKSDKKIQSLKNKLHFGPVILLIYNSPKPKQRFGIIRALFHTHYISIWGYNEEQQIFYVYNSNPKKNIRKDIPVGNQVYNYKDIIQLGKYIGFGVVRNMYISLG